MTLKQLIDFNILSFDVICDKIRNGDHFSLARYGDGEFNAILGKPGANCDGHEYFPEMGKELANTLKSNPDYWIGLHQNAKIQDETLDWINNNNITRTFVSNAVFHCAVRDKLMNQFWEALKGKSVHIIGPDYLMNQEVIKGCRMSRIDGTNTYTSLPEIQERLMAFNMQGRIVLVCASMTAPLIVDYLYQQYGDTATFIDFGSSFDPYVGIKSRSFHKSLI